MRGHMGCNNSPSDGFGMRFGRCQHSDSDSDNCVPRRRHGCHRRGQHGPPGCHRSRQHRHGYAHGHEHHHHGFDGHGPRFHGHARGFWHHGPFGHHGHGRFGSGFGPFGTHPGFGPFGTHPGFGPFGTHPGFGPCKDKPTCCCEGKCKGRKTKDRPSCSKDKDQNQGNESGNETVLIQRIIVDKSPRCYSV